MENTVQRSGDMGQNTKLKIFKDNEGDIHLSIMPIGEHISMHSIEFCNSGSHSKRTTNALYKLYEAMIDDENELEDINIKTHPNEIKLRKLQSRNESYKDSFKHKDIIIEDKLIHIEAVIFKKYDINSTDCEMSFLFDDNDPLLTQLKSFPINYQSSCSLYLNLDFFKYSILGIGAIEDNANVITFYLTTA